MFSNPNLFDPMKGYPIRLWWAGWETDTLKLMQSGWSISAEQEVYDRSLRLALKHPKLQFYAITNNVQCDYMNSIREKKCGEDLQVEYMASRIETVRMPVDFSKFEPIDATPSYSEIREPQHIEDFKIFRTLAPDNEIIIQPSNVDELLSKILELQAPDQEAIRKKKRREWRKFERDFGEYQETYNPQTDMIAQVVKL